MQELMAAGQLVLVIDRCYTLNDVPDAMRYLEGGHARKGCDRAGRSGPASIRLRHGANQQQRLIIELPSVSADGLHQALFDDLERSP
jgi:Zinc-binding dehydrogenase